MSQSDLIQNPATGECVRWHLRSTDTAGRLVRFEMWCAPGGGVTTTHVHPKGDERFEMLAGTVGIELGDEYREAGPGDSVVIPAGVPHRWRTVGDEPAHFFVELDAPRRFEEQLEVYFALGRLGHLGSGGRVPLPMAACLVAGDLDTVRLPGMPRAVQRVVLGSLAGIAHITGDARRVREARAVAANGTAAA